MTQIKQQQSKADKDLSLAANPPLKTLYCHPGMVILIPMLALLL
jgi:hypothetical protein